MSRKRKSTINELAQLDRAYGRKLTRKRQFRIAVKPAIITMLFSFVLLGVVGMSPDAQVSKLQSMPEYQRFQALDPDDAATYIGNIQKAKNPQYWEGDMPGQTKDNGAAKKPNQAQINQAYTDMKTAYAKEVRIPNALLMLTSLWREGIFFLVGLLYGWLYVLPRQIKLEYNISALAERNAAINILTQSFADTSQLPIFGLQAARDNTHGKLRDDFRLLSSIVSKSESNEAVLEGFTTIRHEYADDVQFDLFMEQVATYILQGDISQQTFNNIMRQHNAISEQTTAFQQRKSQRMGKLMQLMYMTFGVGVFVALVVMQILGQSMFMAKIWGGAVGFGGSFVVAGGTLLIYSMMMKQYFDNDLMSM